MELLVYVVREGRGCVREISFQVTLRPSQGWSHWSQKLAGHLQDPFSLGGFAQGASLLPHLGCEVLTLRQGKEVGHQLYA